MASNDGEIDALRARMHDLRGRIVAGSNDVATGARQLTDWRYLFRKMPWLALGGAAAVGFLLVPKKKPAAAAAADRESIEKVEAILAAIDLEALPKRREPSLASALWSSVGNAVVKAGSSFVASQVAAALAPRAPAQPCEEPHPETAPHRPR